MKEDSQLYYTSPPDEIFNEVKEKAIEVWKKIALHPDYIKEKIEYLISLQNVSDNLMVIVAMFDWVNQFRLSTKLSDNARKSIDSRLIAGGAPSPTLFGIENKENILSKYFNIRN